MEFERWAPGVSTVIPDTRFPSVSDDVRIHYQGTADVVENQVDPHDYRRRSQDEECQVKVEPNAERVLLDKVSVDLDRYTFAGKL